MRRAAKIDNTATALIAEAKAYGAFYLPINGTVDGALFFRGQVHIVDWKTPKGKKQPTVKLTDRQAKLLAEGWPIWIVGNSEQLREVLFGKGASDGQRLAPVVVPLSQRDGSGGNALQRYVSDEP